MFDFEEGDDFTENIRKFTVFTDSLDPEMAKIFSEICLPYEASGSGHVPPRTTFNASLLEKIDASPPEEDDQA